MTIKTILRDLLPHGLVCRVQSARLAKARVAADQERSERLRAVRGLKTAPPLIDGCDRAATVRFLGECGLPLDQVDQGSIPAASLSWLQAVVDQHLARMRPLVVLHVGNFVGVSLVALAAMLARQHSQSLVIGVDPDVPHRGIEHPQQYVARLVSACGLQNNVMLVAGSSGGKSISNDGSVFAGYDPLERFADEAACENVVPNLARLMPGRIDLALLDGNHDAAYLTAEIEALCPLLAPDALLVLDDVDESWPEIREVFRRIAKLGFETVGTDGRVGVAKRAANA